MSRNTIIWISIAAVFMAACRVLTGIFAPPAPEAAAPTEAGAIPTQDPHADWMKYHDDLGAFSIKYPPTWERWDSGGYPVILGMSVPPGTTLGEKMMQIRVTQGMSECSNPAGGGSVEDVPPLTVITAGPVSWLKESGSDAGVGNIYAYTSYSTLREAACINITFVLHSTNPGMYDTPPPNYDEAAEQALFMEMLHTFRFDP